MDMKQLSSSNIAAVGYDEITKIMQVEFRRGTTYQYVGVPMRVYEELKQAGSVGTYFNQEVRDVYRFQKI